MNYENEKKQLEILYNAMYELRNTSDNFRLCWSRYIEYVSTSTTIGALLEKLALEGRVKKTTLTTILITHFVYNFGKVAAESSFDNDAISKQVREGGIAHCFPTFLTPRVESQLNLFRDYYNEITEDFKQEMRDKAEGKPGFDWEKLKLSEYDFLRDDFTEVTLLQSALIEAMNNSEKVSDKLLGIELSFDVSSSILRIHNTEVTVSKRSSSNPHILLSIISEDFSKRWNLDEIQDKWNDAEREIDGDSLYGMAYRLQGKIAANSEVKDFLKFTKKYVEVNPKYLR